MKEKIFKNLSLKILSAIFAVVLWTVIVNVYDPTTSYTFSNVQSSLLIRILLQTRITVMRLWMAVRFLCM